MPDMKPTQAALASKALDRIEAGERTLAAIQKARADGRTHDADTPEAVRQHRSDVDVLYAGREKLELELPIEVKAVADALMARDLIAGPEAFFERCLAAYIAERGDHGIDKDWQTTVEAARADIAGGGDGRFDSAFAERLADSEAAARDRDVATVSKDRGSER